MRFANFRETGHQACPVSAITSAVHQLEEKVKPFVKPMLTNQHGADLDVRCHNTMTTRLGPTVRVFDKLVNWGQSSADP